MRKKRPKKEEDIKIKPPKVGMRANDEEVEDKKDTPREEFAFGTKPINKLDV